MSEKGAMNQESGMNVLQLLKKESGACFQSSNKAKQKTTAKNVGKGNTLPACGQQGGQSRNQLPHLRERQQSSTKVRSQVAGRWGGSSVWCE